MRALARAMFLVLLLAGALRADPLPLPDAPVTLVIPDVGAFDRALGGGFRDALEGELDPADPVAAAWRQSRVGYKLEEQWGYFSGDVSITWKEIRALAPRALGLALLDAGNLEAVLVVDTPLAELPLALPDGVAREHAGKSYRLVRLGAGDGSEDVDRRMGLAWARTGSLLVIASSSRAMEAALEALSSAGRAPVLPPLPGLVEVTLDMRRLGKDRYFRREFPWRVAEGEEAIQAALRVEGSDVVEVRRGTGGAGPAPAARRFDLPWAVALGWEADGEGLLPALRGGLLEPRPELAARPVRGIAPLPPARSETVDPYVVNFEKHEAATASWEEGDLAIWKALLGPEAAGPARSWGWAADDRGAVAVVFPWPRERDEEIARAIEATVARRAGPVRVEREGGIARYVAGPGLPLLATRRTGGHLWLAHDATLLEGVREPGRADGAVRWARIDLDAARAATPRIARLEESGDAVKPLADRILGILDWMPRRGSIAVERRSTPGGWEERVVFGSGASAPAP